MKKVIAYIGTWSFYYMGDFVSRLMEYEIFTFLYSTYQRLMNWSIRIQDWGGLEKPWGQPDVFIDEEKEVED